MKKIMQIMLSILGLCVMIGHAQAESVTLAWDANNPSPDGYRIYQRADGGLYDYTQPVNTEPITGTTYTVDGLAAGVSYFFVVRAFVGANESGDSNEVEYTVKAPPCLNLLTPTGDNITEIQAGTFLIEGFPDLMAIIQSVPEDNDQAPYSRNSSGTIFHGPGCRWYDLAKGATYEEIEKCLLDGTCRPCSVCGGH